MTNVNIQTEVAGYFSMKATNINTGVERVLAEFPNLILDRGLNLMGDTSYMESCKVGTGNSTPTIYQTQLDLQVATTKTEAFSHDYGAKATAPYYRMEKKNFSI